MVRYQQVSIKIKTEAATPVYVQVTKTIMLAKHI